MNRVSAAALAFPPYSLLDVDAVERMPAERAQPEVDHLLADRRQLNRMCDREPGRLFLDDDMRLASDFGPLPLIAYCLCLEDQVVERLVAPLADVRAVAMGCIATQERVEENVRVAGVAGPADLRPLV